jgi:hydrogenase maturation protease
VNPTLLVAGIGNIFNGDDGFGVEVARRLTARDLPEGAHVVDFGIRGIDLTYALLDDWSAAVLVDTMQQGAAPGTVSVVAPNNDAGSAALQPEDLMLAPHELDPARVLRLVTALGGSRKPIILVACEPLTFGGEDGAMGLSPPVAAAVGPAIDAILLLARSFIRSGTFDQLEQEGETT